MSIILNGTTGITTPDVTSDGSLKINASAPDNSVVVDASGNVGIGSTAPSTNKLHIESAGATRAVVYNSSNAVGVRIQAETGSGLIQTDTNHPLRFATNNGAVQMQIDTAGRVTMPYQPVFSGNREGKSLIVDTAGLIDFNPIVNTGSHWNTSTNTFTCPVAGRYFVSFYNLTAGSYSTGASSVNIRKNGANFYNAYTEGGTSASGDNYWNSSASGVFDCQASDTITLYMASGVVYGGVYCGATIYLIG